MKWYKLYDIEWDTDEELVEDERLPKFAFMEDQDGTSLDELREGAAADWLSDKYGFCVKSLKVEETDEIMRWFRKEIANYVDLYAC